MTRSIFLNILFLLGFTGAVSAASDVMAKDDFGKEKPKNYTIKNKNAKLDHFSLGAQMKFRGDKVIKSNNINYINFNTSIVYQKGQNSYIVPFKKTVVLNRVTFNPNELLRNHTK